MVIGTRWSHRKSWTSRSTWIAGKKLMQSEHIRLKFTSAMFATPRPRTMLQKLDNSTRRINHYPVNKLDSSDSTVKLVKNWGLKNMFGDPFKR